MKFKHLQVENIRSYQKLDLDFSDGVTVISGVNGSGKSSILEACFMAIFGGEVLRGTALQIPDMIRKGSMKASIILDFEHAGDDYQIEQHYKVTKTGGAGNSKSVLRKNGEIIAEQSKNTYEAIQNLLNMDEKNFQNCAYIRQGDVDALINAKPKDRQQMIDDLLRLGKLEEYRERAHNSKTAVSRILRYETEKKDVLNNKIAQLRAKNLHAELNRRQEAVNQISQLVTEKNDEKEKLTAELTLLESKIKEIEKERAEIEKLKQESFELGRKFSEEVLRRDKLLQDILNTEKKQNDLTAAAETLRLEINAFRHSEDAAAFGDNENIRTFKIADDCGNIELVLAAVKEEESRSLNSKHEISKKAEIIRVQKENIEKEILKKEKETADTKKTLFESESLIEQQSLKINTANASVEGGFSNAETEKKAFLNIFDELYAELENESERNFPADEKMPAENSSKTDDECISGICDISFYSNVVKIEDLPLPSDESSWKMMISDIEKLEEYITQRIRHEEIKITEEEKKKASIKGELDEKEKSIEETEKDFRRLDEEKEKTALNLKTENLEFESKKKRVSDYETLLQLHSAKRIEKTALAAVLKETVPASRYGLGDISAADIDAAYDYVAGQKEKLISESSGLQSRDAEIQKSILKKEELLKAGKCPTCGQEIKADAAHSGHGTADETKQREEIAARLTEINKLKAEADLQAAVLKEISEIDSITEQIKSEMNTLRAEEKGKAEMIEKFKKDLEDIDKQKVELNARKLEHSVFCDARRKDLQKIEQRLANLKTKSSRRNEKLKQLSEREKKFSEAANSILLAYKTLEGERKLHADSQKRFEELGVLKEKIDKETIQLKADLEKIAADDINVKADDEKAVKILTLISGLRGKIEKSVEFGNEKETLKATLFGLKSTMDAQEKAVENYKSQISEKDIKAKTIAEKISAEFGSIEGETAVSEQKQILQNKISGLKENTDELNATKMNILEETGKIRSEIEQLAENENEAAVLRNKLLFLSYVSEDVSVLEDMYLRIRSDMRAKNIEALDQLLNEMFDFIYSNNAYSHLELDSDYNLKVHEKDGSILEPKQLSGGERAIFNLALRCAIYRLLSLGFGENSTGKTSLPPLIFDEPTVFLDSGHVRQLIKLIEHMREDGVGQIIVVSHDESLIDSADVNFRIEKDPVTNASAAV